LLYLPSVALAIAVAFGLAAVRPALQPAARGLLVAVIMLGAARSAVRVPEWQSTQTIFAALHRDRPDSFRAHWVVARMARSEARSADALASYARAVELWPHRRGLVTEAIAHAAAEGQTGWAQRLAMHAVRSWPDDLDSLRLLAALSLDLGDTVAARVAVDAGMLISPADPLLLRMAAAVSELEGQ
jgi:predicted Zn-dependent protease